MSARFLCGPDASITWVLSGAVLALHANAFSISLTASTAEAVGFGDTDPEVRPCMRRGTAVISGITTDGVATNQFGSAQLLNTATPAALTMLFNTGSSIEYATAVMSGISGSAQPEAYSQSSYSFVKSGGLTETWATS